MGARRAVWRSGVAAMVLAAASVGPMASGAAATEYSQYCYYIEDQVAGYPVPVPPPPVRDLRGGMAWMASLAPDDPPRAGPVPFGNKYSCWLAYDPSAAGDDRGSWRDGLVGMATTRSALGYWVADRSGRVWEAGDDAVSLGGVSHLPLAAPVVDIESSTLGDGYWLAAADGGVFSFGAARYFGSAAFTLAGEITGMAARPQGDGYWLAGADGGVFSFGGAPFLGSAARLPLRAPVVEIEPAPDGEGYWLVAADGGVFAFGSARFAGAPAGSSMAAPIADLAATGLDGYVLLGRDGGVFAYGSARFHGSSLHMFHNAAAIEATGDPYGYWVLHGGATG